MASSSATVIASMLVAAKATVMALVTAADAVEAALEALVTAADAVARRRRHLTAVTAASYVRINLFSFLFFSFLFFLFFFSSASFFSYTLHSFLVSYFASPLPSISQASVSLPFACQPSASPLPFDPLPTVFQSYVSLPIIPLHNLSLCLPSSVRSIFIHLYLFLFPEP